VNSYAILGLQITTVKICLGLFAKKPHCMHSSKNGSLTEQVSVNSEKQFLSKYTFWISTAIGFTKRKTDTSVSICVVSGFRHGVNEICAFLGFHTA
jgi:hypothetical protein